MAKGESLRKAITDLYEEYGKPIVDRVVDTFDGDVTPQQVRQAVKKVAPPSLAAKPQKALAVQRKALPAPPKILALPAPGPGLPPLASKPRGGQWWVDKSLEYGNTSPEEAARQGALALALTRWVPEDVPLPPGDPAARLRQAFQNNMVPQTTETDAQKWLERALTKYYKNDFGAPDDPLRSLAERGLHYEPDMTPEKWKATVDSYLAEDKIGDITVPSMLFNKDAYPGAGDAFTTEARMAMPWLAKAPVTDKLYGIQSGGLDLSHFTDEFMNALGDPGASGLPMDFAIRPESLGRMTFPQAVEHVGKINQFRAKEMERAALSNLDSPAVQTFKEYAENNPMGLRWTELKVPETKPSPDWGWEDIGGGRYRDPSGVLFSADKERLGVFKNEQEDDYWHLPADKNPRKALEEALKYEGDTMGHCVGGYCPDVMSGRSRIFSLRDAKGEPHVTIETSPSAQWRDVEHAADEDPDFGDAWNAWRYGYDISRTPGRPQGTFEEYLRTNEPDLLSRFEEQGSSPDRIVQIKGKQNRAPKDDYLPFVQDFVKSQQWSNVGDLGNTGLVKLPDGRYITQQQFDSVIGDEGLDDRYQSYDFNARQFPRDPSRMGAEDWAQFQRHFEGYAIGGRVDADRCFCHNPLSVKKGR
jgi:hypothetical protein